MLDATYELPYEVAKGMLQIYINQDIPGEVLTQIFVEALGG